MRLRILSENSEGILVYQSIFFKFVSLFVEPGNIQYASLGVVLVVGVKEILNPLCVLTKWWDR